jgi:alpha-amylase
VTRNDLMPAICFYFQVHQPKRVKHYRVFDIGKDHNYFNDDSEKDTNNKKVMAKVMNKCYLPTNNLLKHLLEKHPEFKISFSLSGIFIEQMEEDFPELLKSFQDLEKAGRHPTDPSKNRVEFLSETYYHSLAFLYSRDEFDSQVKLHRKKIEEHFGQTPTVFRNTELIYNNELGVEIEKLGYKGIITEGADHILDWRSPNFLYQAKGTKHLKLLLKNYKLSDDIAFRFSSKEWKEWPLHADKFAQWVNAVNGNGEVINLFMDYETFGEHQWEDTGIFSFLEHLPAEVLKHPDNSFVTPSEAVAKFEARGEVDIHNFISWADVERDLSAWRSNAIQHDALAKVYELEQLIHEAQNQELLADWRRLQTSDHFYYMCTKWWQDGDVHKYFSPYGSPYEAFINYMNALHDLKLRAHEKVSKDRAEKVEKIKRSPTRFFRGFFAKGMIN